MPSLIQKHAHVKGQRSNHHILKFQPNPYRMLNAVTCIIGGNVQNMRLNAVTCIIAGNIQNMMLNAVTCIIAGNIRYMMLMILHVLLDEMYRI